MRSYFARPPSHPLDGTYSITDLSKIVLADIPPEGICYHYDDAASVRAAMQAEKRARGKAKRKDGEEGDGGGDDDDGDDDEEEEEAEDDDEVDDDEEASAAAAVGGGGGGSAGEAEAEGKGSKGDGDGASTPPPKKGSMLSRVRAGTVGRVAGAASSLNPMRQMEQMGSLFRKPPTLEEELDNLRWEVEQEVYSQMPPPRDEGGGFTLNPIAKALGPVQKALDALLLALRAFERVVTWDDPLLSFQLTFALGIVTGGTFLLGELLMLLPWGHIFEWTFRLLGAAAFGPHMYWLGKQYRADARAAARVERKRGD